MRIPKTVAKIKSRIRALKKAARTLELQARRRIRSAATLISRLGLSPQELKEAYRMSKPGSSRHKLGPAPIKYRDRKGNTWSGRGKTPRWLVAAEKAGKKRESFVVRN